MPGLDPVVFLSPSSIGTALLVTVADINSPTELNSLSAASGDLIIARTVGAASDSYTYYIADATSDAQSMPYIVSSATAGIRFIATAGHAVNNAVRFASTLRLNSLTASRIVTLDSNKDSATPATITLTDQSIAFTSTALLSVVDGNFSIVGSSDSSKTIRFEADAQTAGDTLTIDTGAQTDSRTATFPVLTGNSILALSNSTLTATRIPFATTNGILTDSANLTFTSTTGVITHTGTAPQHLIVVPAATNQNIFSVGGSTTGATFCNYTNTSGSFLMGINGSAGGFLGTASTAYATVLCSFTATHLELGSNATIRLRIQDTGEVVGLLATDATSSGTGAWQVTGGANIAKNLLHRQGRGVGVTSTTTAAGTTTLTSASTEIQTFVGSTTQTVQFPAANLFGAGIAVCFTINNQSSGTVTPTRAGSDVFQGGGTTDPVLAGASTSYRSNGVSIWLKV